MKKVLIFSFLVFAFITTVKAQPSFIQKKLFLPKSNTADSRDVIETTPNNYVMMGFTIDSIGTQLQQRMTLAGLDQNGNLSWRKSYGSNNFTYMSYIWSAGIMIKKNNFLYSAIIVADSNLQQPSVFIKFDFNGDTIWQKKYYETPNKQLFFTSVAPSVDNGFLITGAIQTNTPTFNNHPTVALYLLKTDINGNKLWDKRIYKPNLDETQCGYKVIQDSLTKRIFIVGSQDVGSNSCSNILILDSLGTQIGQKNYSGPNGGGLIDIIKTNDNNFVSIGGNNYPFQIAGMNTTKSMLIKIDTAGNLIYKQEYDTLVVVNAFNNVSELNNGDLIMGGELGTLVQYGVGINDVLRIIKTDKNGNLIWKKYFDNYTDNHNQDQLEGMNLTSDNHIIFTSSCVSGEPAPRPYMFYKTDTSFCDVNSIGCYNFTGIEEKEKQIQKITCSPNPANDYTTLNFSDLSFSEPLTLEVRNVLGLIIFSTEINSTNNYLLSTLDFSSGIYYLNVKTEKRIVGEQKLVIIK